MSPPDGDRRIVAGAACLRGAGAGAGAVAAADGLEADAGGVASESNAAARGIVSSSLASRARGLLVFATMVYFRHASSSHSAARSLTFRCPVQFRCFVCYEQQPRQPRALHAAAIASSASASLRCIIKGQGLDLAGNRCNRLHDRLVGPRRGGSKKSARRKTRWKRGMAQCTSPAGHPPASSHGSAAADPCVRALKPPHVTHARRASTHHHIHALLMEHEATIRTAARLLRSPSLMCTYQLRRHTVGRIFSSASYGKPDG
jgi:hypothetical protein